MGFVRGNRRARAENVIDKKLSTFWTPLYWLAKQAELPIQSMSKYLGRAVQKGQVQRTRCLNSYGNYVTLFRKAVKE